MPNRAGVGNARPARRVYRDFDFEKAELIPVNVDRQLAERGISASERAVIWLLNAHEAVIPNPELRTRSVLLSFREAADWCRKFVDPLRGMKLNHATLYKALGVWVARGVMEFVANGGIGSDCRKRSRWVLSVERLRQWLELLPDAGEINGGVPRQKQRRKWRVFRVREDDDDFDAHARHELQRVKISGERIPIFDESGSVVGFYNVAHCVFVFGSGGKGGWCFGDDALARLEDGSWIWQPKRIGDSLTPAVRISKEKALSLLTENGLGVPPEIESDFLPKASHGVATTPAIVATLEKPNRESAIHDDSDAIAKCVNGRRRDAAFFRDHVWLAWQRDDGLGPPAIRDRWNSLSDDDRRNLARRKRSAEKIAPGDGGRRLVILALKLAASEREKFESPKKS